MLSHDMAFFRTQSFPPQSFPHGPHFNLPGKLLLFSGDNIKQEINLLIVCFVNRNCWENTWYLWRDMPLPMKKKTNFTTLGTYYLHLHLSSFIELHSISPSNTRAIKSYKDMSWFVTYKVNLITDILMKKST